MGALVTEYDSGMTTKITVSLPDELVDHARSAVAEGAAASVSAYVAEALVEKARRGSLRDLLDDLDRELGPPDGETMAEAVRQLGQRTR